MGGEGHVTGTGGKGVRWRNVVKSKGIWWTSGEPLIKLLRKWNVAGGRDREAACDS